MTLAQSHSLPTTAANTIGLRRPATVILLATAFCAAARAQPAAELRQAQQRVFQAALQSVAPCVVRIDTVGGALPVEQGSGAAPGGFRQAGGPTTGLICTADGYIITSSFGFIRDPAVITVVCADGRRCVARLVARDHPAKLTLLKIDADGLPVPQWLPADQLCPGQWTLLAGYGYGGATPALSVGVLSAVARLDGRAVQTDARTSPANYGGPLFDLEGHVLGVCVPKAGQREDEFAGVEWYDSGVGFAIRADYITEHLPRLKAGEDLHQGYLGASYEAARPVVGDSPDEQPTGGVRVMHVFPGPAAAAGLQPSDLITHVDAAPTPRLVDLARALARRVAGDVVEITYQRGAEGATTNSTLITLEELRAAMVATTTSQPAGEP